MGKVIKLHGEERGGKGMCISIDYIEDRASEILREYNIYSIPIDPVLVANKLGITVYDGSFVDPNMSGLISKNGDKTEIIVEKSHHPNRQRFTIAHEIGHLILHIKKETSEEEYVTYQRNENFDVKEAEANRFAAALLMPKDIVVEHFKKYNNLPDDIVISILAKEFSVSEIAMRNRLNNLGLLSYGW